MAWFSFRKKKSEIELETQKVVQVLNQIDAALVPLSNFQIERSHKETFRYLWYDFWEAHVPASSQSAVLQAELLRRIEKLQHEAQANGNINWDEGFEYFCDWLLSEFAKFDELVTYMENARLILTKLKNHGTYAKLTWADDFPEPLFEPQYIAYCENALYDYLYEMVCVIYETHTEPIAFETEDGVHR